MWTTWALSALLVLQVSRTAITAVLIIAISTLIVEVHAPQRALSRAYPLLLMMAASFAVLRVALTAVTTHGGSDVIARIPAVQLPALLGGFTVGGTIHRAIVLRTVNEGILVVAIIAALAAFNAVVSHYELLRAIPRAFSELGLVISVALAFVPATLAGVQAVREADRARTGELQHRRSWRRTLPAVLDSSLERAAHLSESMESRGLGRRRSGPAERLAAALSLTALGLLAVATATVITRSGAAIWLVAPAVALLTAAVVVVSRAGKVGRLRRRALERQDQIVLAVIVIAPVFAGALLSGGQSPWDPAQSLLPPTSVQSVLATMLLAAPLLARRPTR